MFSMLRQRTRNSHLSMKFPMWSFRSHSLRFPFAKDITVVFPNDSLKPNVSHNSSLISSSIFSAECLLFLKTLLTLFSLQTLKSNLKVLLFAFSYSSYNPNFLPSSLYDWWYILFLKFKCGYCVAMCEWKTDGAKSLQKGFCVELKHHLSCSVWFKQCLCITLKLLALKSCLFLHANKPTSSRYCVYLP